MPAALMYCLKNPKYSWCYETVPQKHMNNRVIFWPRGKVLGGSSSIDAMVYVRGHASDYDRWEKEGATGWSYSDCLPYFRRSQTHEMGEDLYRGGDGPLYVSRGKWLSPLFQAFVDAGIQAGYPHTEDCNGFQQEGFGNFDMTIKEGKWCSTSTAYLWPAARDEGTNLTVKTGALVTRLLFEGTKTIGVEYTRGKDKIQARVTREVILSAGSINSPQILMLSGIGNADDLRRLDIPVIVNSPGVGQNLQDHLELYIQQQCTQPVTLYRYQWKFPLTMIGAGLEWFVKSSGVAATTHLEAGAFIRSEPGIPHPDIQLHFLPSVVLDHGQQMGTCDAFQAHVGTMRATSTGQLKLRSNDPREPPLLDPNYLATEQDRKDLRACVRLTREVFAQSAFDKFRGPELLPGPEVQTDSQVDAFVRSWAETAYHPSCTAKMGADSDPMAVLSPDCRVKGVENLRVVDASIMPSIVSGNLNAAIVMLAEKASDLILGRDPLLPCSVPVWKPGNLNTQRNNDTMSFKAACVV